MIVVKAIIFASFVILLFMCDIAESFSASTMWHRRMRKDIPSTVHFHGININDRKYSLWNKCIARQHLFSTTSLSAVGTPSKSGGSGGTALDTRVDQKVSTKIRDEIEKNWRLILHDDTIHTIQQVCDIVSASCPLCPGPRAYEVTMEVHMTGAGTICVANKKIVTEYTKILQAAGLTVSMAPDEDFESSGNDE